MKLAAAYIRCSTDKQEGSLPAQRAQLTEYARREGYEVIEWFVDDGVSGTSFDRPGIRALTAAASNSVDWEYILVWDRSRLGRPQDPRAAMSVTYMLEGVCGKCIVALQGSKATEDRTINALMEVIEFGAAGQESVRKSRDVLRGQCSSAGRGSRPGGSVPFGFDALYELGGKPIRRIRFHRDRTKTEMSLDGASVIRTVAGTGKMNEETVALVPGDVAKVQAVQRVFREFNSGLSARTVACGLNEDGILSPRGGKWGRNTIIRILQNPAFKGMLAWNRVTWAKFHTVQGDGQVVQTDNPTKKIKNKPEADWVVRDGRWEGLVSVEEWERANKRLKTSVASFACKGKGTHSHYLASGLLVCTCGYQLRGCGSSDRRRPGHRFEDYRCAGATERGRTVCTAKRVRRQVVDDYLERRIREFYFEPVASAALWKEIENELDGALASLEDDVPNAQERQQLAKVNTRISNLVDAVADGVLDASEIKARLLPLRAEKATLERKLASQTGPQDPKDIARLRRRILAGCRERMQCEADLWPGATPEQRKAIVRAHVASIGIDVAKQRMRTEFYPLVATAEPGIRSTTYEDHGALCGVYSRPGPLPARRGS